MDHKQVIRLYKNIRKQLRELDTKKYDNLLVRDWRTLDLLLKELELVFDPTFYCQNGTIDIKRFNRQLQRYGNTPYWQLLNCKNRLPTTKQ